MTNVKQCASSIASCTNKLVTVAQAVSSNSSNTTLQNGIHLFLFLITLLVSLNRIRHGSSYQWCDGQHASSCGRVYEYH